MRTLWRIFKATIYAVLALLAGGVVMTVMIWTKGLFALLVVFGVVVWRIYAVLEHRDFMRRKLKARREGGQ